MQPMGRRLFQVTGQMACAEPACADTAPHVRNFLNAVRSRNPEELEGGILEGHLSAVLVHMANISYRTGRKLEFDPSSETFPDDAQANAYVRQAYRQPYAVPEKV